MPSMSTRVVSPTLAGRSTELERLQAALDRAIESSSSTVLVAGEAGVGKTRLVTELASSAHERGMLVLTGGAIGLGDSDLPYGPFAEAFRALHRSVGRDRFLRRRARAPTMSRGWSPRRWVVEHRTPQRSRRDRKPGRACSEACRDSSPGSPSRPPCCS